MSNILISTINGPMLVNDQDFYVGQAFILHGEYSQKEISDICSLCPQGGLAVDIGANIGAVTVPLAKVASTVLAFEPNRFNFQLLNANVALADLLNVFTFPQAVSDRAGQALIDTFNPRELNNFGNLTIHQDGQGELIETVRLDDFTFQACDLIKIDVEGHEAAVLTGAAETIDHFKPTIRLEIMRGDNQLATEALQILHNQGYLLFEHATELFEPNNFNSNPLNPWPGVSAINAIAIHRSKPIPAFVQVLSQMNA